MNIGLEYGMIFSTSNQKILYLTMPIVRRKNLSQTDLMDCKTKTLEVQEKLFLMGSLDCCQCFEIQKKLGG